ncbi:MAG: hypothetical protein P0S95_01210 [Rhabdochlamydiaceae bacterium]|nr:hypothetical protein [Candidatus Amphrikana amoebophyrae]
MGRSEGIGAGAESAAAATMAAEAAKGMYVAEPLNDLAAAKAASITAKGPQAVKDAILNQVTGKNDPTISYFHTMGSLTSKVDQHAVGTLLEQAKVRRETSMHMERLNQMILKLNEDLPKLQADKGLKESALEEKYRADFEKKYREAVQELEEIWKSHEEEFGYILPDGGNFFIKNDTNQFAIDATAIEKAIEHCHSLRRCLETVKLPELDITLQTALQLNVILQQAFAKLTEKMSDHSRTAVANQIR